MRYAILGALCVMLGSCREILPVQTAATISGYELDGIVTAANGLALAGAQVRLYYEYNYVSSTPTDTIPVIVRDSTKIVDIAVYTPNYVLVRELFLGYLHVGPVARAFWDGLDQSGTAVPSGKYLIRYLVDTAIVKFSTVIVEGHTTAVTDANGKFVIRNDRFPVGTVADFYFANGTFDGAYQVVPVIDLVFVKGTLLSTYQGVSLNSNQITHGAFTLQ